MIARNSPVDRAIGTPRGGGIDGRGGGESEWTEGCEREDGASTPPPDISSPGSYVCHEF